MSSAIDSTKPTSGHAYTADVRANFATAASEITDLQAEAATLQTQIAALQNDIANLRMFVGTGTWQWQSAPQSGTISNAHAGIDTDAAIDATTLWITSKSDDQSDFAAALRTLAIGDGILVWDRKNSANRMRFSVTAPVSDFSTYFTVPVTLTMQSGVEPINNADVNVQFSFVSRG